MPRRNNEQRIKRNETRRNLKKLSRKAIFCLEHQRITRPDMYKEATELYEYLNALHPHKHNLTKTAVYQRSIQNISVKERVLKHAAECRKTGQSREVQPRLEIPGQSREVQPRLEIPLMSSEASETTCDQAKITKETSQEQATVTDVERQQLLTISPEEIDMLIKDLHQEPALKSFFNEIEVCGSEARQKPLEEEINKIIQDEFEALGADLQDLINVDDELMC